MLIIIMTATRNLFPVTEDVKGVSAYVIAPFDIALTALKEAGYEPISLEQNAKLRMQEGPRSYISRNGNWVSEGVLYLPDKRVLLTRNSPILENPAVATQAHGSESLFYVTEEQVEKAMQHSVDLRGKAIPTKRFAEDTRTVFMFGAAAKDYGEFLREYGINEMPLWLFDTKDKPFVNQAWLGGFVNGGRSVLVGNNWGLEVEVHLRGVRSSGAEGDAKASKKEKTYTGAEISRALRDLGFLGLEKSLFEELKK